MNEKTLMTQTEDRMKNVIEAYKKDLASMRAGRATPLLLDKVLVDYYGVPTPINQVASIAVSYTHLDVYKRQFVHKAK